MAISNDMASIYRQALEATTELLKETGTDAAERQSIGRAYLAAVERLGLAP